MLSNALSVALPLPSATNLSADVSLDSDLANHESMAREIDCFEDLTRSTVGSVGTPC